MQKRSFHNIGTRRQYLISVAVVTGGAFLGLLLHDWLGYRVIAFILLVAVSILAMFLDIVPVLLAASLSALLWNFLFIPPRFTLTVGTSDDRIMLVMYFIVAMINGVLTYKIRQIEKEVKAKDEKAKSIRFYNTLLNSLSHELRTPITTIIGCTDNLLANDGRLSEKDKTELLSEVYRASERLNQQVENLLNMSRLESGSLQVKKDWCDINELIYKTIHRLESNLRSYTVAVDIPDAFPLFKLDFGLMEQVMYNLLINVTQHTPKDTLITIQAEAQKDRLIISLADNGKGFPDDEMDKVFDKFYRLKSSTPGGTGLGLSIVKGFVEAHNGVVTLRNLPVCGSKITIEIPAESSMIKKMEYE